MNESDGCSEPSYARAPGFVWRLASDRVVVRRIADHTPDAAADLFGAAAVVWVALDEPRSITDIEHEIAAAGGIFDSSDVRAALTTMLERGLVVTVVRA